MTVCSQKKFPFVMLLIRLHYSQKQVINKSCNEGGYEKLKFQQSSFSREFSDEQFLRKSSL